MTYFNLYLIDYILIYYTINWMEPDRMKIKTVFCKVQLE